MNNNELLEQIDRFINTFYVQNKQILSQFKSKKQIKCPINKLQQVNENLKKKKIYSNWLNVPFHMLNLYYSDDKNSILMSTDRSQLISDRFLRRNTQDTQLNSKTSANVSFGTQTMVNFLLPLLHIVK